MASWNLKLCFEQLIPAIETSLNGNKEFKVATLKHDVKFSILASDTNETLLVSIQSSAARIKFDRSTVAEFALSARSQDWQKFFEQVPKAPYQSYWGILRVFGKESGVGISGDISAFSKSVGVWRIVLETAREIMHNQPVLAIDQNADDGSVEEDSIVGKYIWLKISAFGQTKIFYECAGHGPKHILWLHTAGADSRQFHELMNNKSLQERYTMYAFDMPAHGRSSPGSKQVPQGYANSEEVYIEVIHEVIKKLHLMQPIVSGASMAGHICLAVALRAQEMGVGGVIPVEAAEYLPLVQPPYELGGHFNESIINPERVCGMTSPTSTKARKQLIWWIYSSQAARVFQGDLQFYFKGWDGRNRLEHIDTSRCPVYMLTGEYDYSCTPEVSAAAAAKIPGAQFEKMDCMGHFPMTEDPEQFLVYLNRALDFIEKSRIG
ncbi:uncharacterized protein PFLUO_LOCUS6288 [Penicillium psychrofluorescens]|uniref:uncharacterized protein n=1 Tax=Penicillium psychrofluorescens TaxID=3158075 RepID=UPI003CCCED0B